MATTRLGRIDVLTTGEMQVRLIKSDGVAHSLTITPGTDLSKRLPEIDIEMALLECAPLPAEEKQKIVNVARRYHTQDVIDAYNAKRRALREKRASEGEYTAENLERMYQQGLLTRP